MTEHTLAALTRQWRRWLSFWSFLSTFPVFIGTGLDLFKSIVKAFKCPTYSTYWYIQYKYVPGRLSKASKKYRTQTKKIICLTFDNRTNRRLENAELSSLLEESLDSSLQTSRILKSTSSMSIPLVKLSEGFSSVKERLIERLD